MYVCNMKRIKILAIALISLTACNKDEDVEDVATPTHRGEWVLYQKDIRNWQGLTEQEHDELYNFKRDSVEIGYFSPYKKPYTITEDSLYFGTLGYSIQKLTVQEMELYRETPSLSLLMYFKR